MISKQEIEVLNILFFAVLILSLTSYTPPKPTGQFYSSTSDSPECVFNNSGNISEIPVDRCCFEAREKAQCSTEAGKLSCSNSEGSELELNSKAVDYCSSKGISLE